MSDVLSQLLIQGLNGIQYGLLLFLVASGLTLVFGVMGVINLAHGSFYMLGAYLAFLFFELTGSLFLAILIAVPITIAAGYLLEATLFRPLYIRDHLYQVLLTYGLILVLDELRRLAFGNDVHGIKVPALFDFSIPLTQTLNYPAFRIVISVICLIIAGALYLLIQRTRLGMIVRAGSTNREMVQSLGIDINLVYRVLFALGAALAAFAGMIAAPVTTVFPGMGNEVLIISFVVVVIGGIGSIKGAFVGSLLVGLADTFGQVFVPSLSGMAVYVVMAAVLIWRPTGLYGSPK
ncbi:branched-chain amino acid ABC transporter permease [Pseudorhodoplanes sp.]|uniref:branched-chain amino acid ABC transporter permease n=1 Tax=Pseudorhodoplanes sp. TaxID=1934341 RepID=UPI003D10E07B